RRLERSALGGIGSVAAVRQRAGMPHSDALGRAPAGNQREHGLRETLRRQRLREFLLLRAADFAYDQERLGLRIGRVEGDEIGIARSLDRVATDAYPHRSADAVLRE